MLLQNICALRPQRLESGPIRVIEMAEILQDYMRNNVIKQSQIVLHDNLPIIEVAETWLLDMLLADPGAARSILVRLADRIAVVEPSQFDLLIARLRKLGHTPKVLAE
jgi:hypothetical protein